MADLLSVKPGQAEPTAVQLLLKTQNMPAISSIFPDMLRKAKGLVFMSSWKAGILYVGGQRGAGFVIAHLPDGSWSAPAFFTWTAAGGGLTLGVSKVDTLIVLNTDKAMEPYLHPEGSFKFGAGLNIDYIKPGEAGNQMKGESLVAEMTTGEKDAFIFPFSSGLLFDLTATAGVTYPDKTTNTKVYGRPDATADKILRGELPVPQQAHHLYDTLNQLTAAAPWPGTAATGAAPQAGHAAQPGFAQQTGSAAPL